MATLRIQKNVNDTAKGIYKQSSHVGDRLHVKQVPYLINMDVERSADFATGTTGSVSLASVLCVFEIVNTCGVPPVGHDMSPKTGTRKGGKIE